MTLVKRIISIVFILNLIGLTNKTFSQTTVTIPDTNFATYLQAVIPTAMNGKQMDTSKVCVKTLTSLNVSSKNIADLTGVQYFPSLKLLYCNSNFLTNIPPLSDSLQFLECESNQLTNLPTLSSTKLQILFCDNNKLTSLPILPNSVNNITCYFNLLTTLPALPKSLQFLFCNNNSLISLPALPNSLITIDCSSNQLTSLPDLPNSLQGLGCINNKIVCFPSFPNSLIRLIIYNNPFTCLPNYITCMNATTLAFPLCNLDNPSGCPVSKDLPTEIVIPNIFTPNGDNINDEFFNMLSYFSQFKGFL
jgi:Leucine-rich repeat (LRR) protein